MSGLLLIVFGYYRHTWRLARRLFEELGCFGFIQVLPTGWAVFMARELAQGHDTGCLGWQARIRTG